VIVRDAKFGSKFVAENVRRASISVQRFGRVALAVFMLTLASPQALSAQPILDVAPVTWLAPTSFPAPYPGPVVIDYSGTFTSATPSRLKKAGVGVVIRYVGASKWKCLTRREANALRSAGIDIAAVYETDAKWMLRGRAAGVAAAKKARAAVIACGGPKKPFIYFACDTPTRNYSAVNACLRGAASVLGADHVGIYGSYSVCANALKSGYAAKAWQTVAWSSGRVLPQSVLYQNARRVHGGLGLDYDSNFVRADDFGQWGYVAPGNVSWAAQATPTTETLASVDFVSGSTGWAVGSAGSLLRTTDAGAVWTKQSAETTAGLRAVDFANSADGWAVGDEGTVLRTTDGGTTWIPQSVPTTATLAAVRSTDASRSWAVGDAGTTLATTDGGATWTPQSAPTTESLSALDFTSSTTGWAVGSAGTVLRTVNGGAAWTKQSAPTTSALTSVDFTDSETGWAVGARGTILCTTNGGVTWKLQSAPTTATLTSVHFADSVKGWTVGEAGTVLSTANGGSTWTPQFAPTISNLNAVRFTSGSNGFAVGDGGVVLRASTAKVSPFGTIVGTVTDAVTGAPIGGVSLSLGSKPTAPTAPDGSFVAARLKPGTYSVTFSNARYITRAAYNVVVSAGLRTTVRMRLTRRAPTSITAPSTLPTAPLGGQPITLTATISPSPAATSAVTVISGSHYEQKWVTKRVGGKTTRAKIWYWRPRFTLRMTPGVSGRLTVQTRLAVGKWRVQVKYPGSGRYLPSTSGARVYVK
jgi:photosystem II stability/assembly factor-like uncharacterized protein